MVIIFHYMLQMLIDNVLSIVILSLAIYCTYAQRNCAHQLIIQYSDLSLVNFLFILISVFHQCAVSLILSCYFSKATFLLYKY